MPPSDVMLYNVARAVVLALTGDELFNEEISDDHAQEAIKILRSLVESCAVQK